MLYSLFLVLGALCCILGEDLKAFLSESSDLNPSFLESKEAREEVNQQIQRFQKISELNRDKIKGLKSQDIPDFTPDICREYDPNVGFMSAYNVGAKADSLLLGNDEEKGLFDHVVHGFAVTMLNASSGKLYI